MTLGSATTFTFDEVHHRPIFRSANKCTLNVTAEVSSKDRTRKGLLLNERRSARTPPSTFLFLPIQFSNSPGPKTPPQLLGACRNSDAPDNSRMLIHCSSEELQRHTIAPRTRLASGVPEAVYRLAFGLKSTANVGFFALPHTAICYG